jgi:hypothetical protein
LKLEADLFLETENGAVVVALAPFAEGTKKWKQVAQTLAPTLAWWRELRKRAGGIAPFDRDLAAWVLFPMEGLAVELIS